MKVELNVARDFKDVYKIVELEINLLYLPVLNGLASFEVSGMSIYRLFAFLRAHQLLFLAIACQGRTSSFCHYNVHTAWFPHRISVSLFHFAMSVAMEWCTPSWIPGTLRSLVRIFVDRCQFMYAQNKNCPVEVWNLILFCDLHFLHFIY